LDETQIALDESLSLARDLGDKTRELMALNRLAVLASIQGDSDGAERLFQEMHAGAVAAGNLGGVAYERKDYAAARAYTQQALALSREIGVQDMVATTLLNLAETNIVLGELPAARTDLRDGLALALRLGYLRIVLAAVTCFGYLAYAEGLAERALSLMGLARKHPAWSHEHQHEMDKLLAEWPLDPSVVEAGLAKGAKLDWSETIRELQSAA
jgi:tetratricopeptide (TPR) repeat protein